jgi:flagella basal body P-ring formation protein FlgA
MRLQLDKEDLFWVGNVIGIAALLVTIFFLAPQKERERREHEQLLERQKQECLERSMPAVLYAKHDIDSGATITKADVAVKKIAQDKLAKQMLQRTEQIVGKTASEDIEKGSTILDSQIEEN